MMTTRQQLGGFPEESPKADKKRANESERKTDATPPK